LPPSPSAGNSTWRTRSDPFADVWDSDVVPLLDAEEEGVLETTTIFSLLQECHPGRFQDGQLRTLIPDPPWREIEHPARLAHRSRALPRRWDHSLFFER
jgi:hypothetical protein